MGCGSGFGGLLPCAWCALLFPLRGLSARGRPRRGRPAGAAARPGCARSWTRLPARAGWQRRGKGSSGGRRVGGRPGSGLPEEPVVWVRAGRPGDRAVPRLPSRALGCGAPGVFLQAAEDSVADLAFERAQRLFRGFAFGQFLVVVGAALGVPVADLGDRGHVDGVVEPPVPAPGQPVDLPRAGGHLDRRGAVVGGEVVPAAEAGTRGGRRRSRRLR